MISETGVKYGLSQTFKVSQVYSETWVMYGFKTYPVKEAFIQ